MRTRPSARLLIVDPQERVLLFRFVHKSGALAGKAYWATPGGDLEPGESFEQAARRELREETGIKIDTVRPQVARREFVLQLPSGEHVQADERFFRIDVQQAELSRDGWTAEENDVMAAHRWWSKAELAAIHETVWPKDLADLL